MKDLTFHKLEAQVRNATQEIVKQLSVIESVSRLEFKIEVEGRISGEMLIKYKICTNYDADVVGNSLGPVLLEAKRRRGWTEAHEPTMISFVKPDPIPFTDGSRPSDEGTL